MAARLGNVLYWLGAIIAVLAIGGAITWNGVAFYELRQVQIEAEQICGETEDQVDCALRLADEQNKSTAESGGIDFRGLAVPVDLRVDKANEAVGSAMIYGGLLFLIGLVAYGVGWAVRYVLRGSS